MTKKLAYQEHMLAAAERQEEMEERAKAEAEEEYGHLNQQGRGQMPKQFDSQQPSANVTGQGKHEIHPHFQRKGYGNVVHVVGDDE